MRTVRGCSFFHRALLTCVLALAGGVGCQLAGSDPPPAPAVPVLPGQSTGVFTTAHASFGAALNDFLDRRPEPEQPIEFPHNMHVEERDRLHRVLSRERDDGSGARVCRASGPA